MKTDKLAAISHSGKILHDTLLLVIKNVKPGVSGRDLNIVAENYIISQNAKPSFKGYKGFPSGLCVSINDVVVHGIPSSYKFQSGDIIGLDLGVFYHGYHTDSAVTVIVNKHGCETAESLIKRSKKPDFSDLNIKERMLCVCYNSLYKGIDKALVGSRTGDIGESVQNYIEKFGLGVVRELVGHGVGEHIHEDPSIPNFGSNNTGATLHENQTIAIEPMVTVGDWHVKLQDDDWGIATKDGSLSAHFEHTVYLTKDGPIILT
jgi:methionyl aminopeptidase